MNISINVWQIKPFGRGRQNTSKIHSTSELTLWGLISLIFLSHLSSLKTIPDTGY